MNHPQKDLVRTVLQVLFVGLLIGASLWILHVFIGAIVWATMIAVSTWPLMRGLERLLFGKRKLAVAGMTIVLLAVVLGPFLGAVAAIVANVDDIAAFARKLPTYQLPPAPAWLQKLPIAGPEVSRFWDQAATAGVPALLKEASPYVGDVAKWFASRVGSVSALLVELLLTIVIAAVMYAKGETAVRGVRAFARRLAGSRGEGAVDLAGGAIRGVAMGVVLTAIAQSLLAGAGLLVAGVPFAPALTVAMFILAIAQIGPMPILIPAVIWAYGALGSGWGTGLLVWSLAVGTVDNVLRPILIKKGADLPLLLIFAGVIGGLVSIGLMGVFVGPVLLSVAYTLLTAWVDREDGAAAPEPEGVGGA